ncbi:TPA: VanZ family protein [Clostridioides difficile]|nr:VanZ family protein [Clostridioides difficile]
MKSKKVTLGLLIFYLIALIWIIIFKLQFSFEYLPHIRNINLIPFGESVIVNGKMDLSEIIQNALAFIPLGLFIHVLWEQKSLLKQFIPIVCTSLLFEVIQFTFAIGATDITDLISNSLGGIIGVILAITISKVTRKNWIQFINIISLIGAITLTLFIAVLLLANM